MEVVSKTLLVRSICGVGLAISIFLIFVGCRSSTDATGLPSGGSTTILLSIPEAKTNLSVSGLSDSSLVLTWSDNADKELIYEIQQCAGSNCTNFSDNSNSPKAANTTTLSITGLASATVYRFRVRASNSIGGSDWLTSGDVTTSALTVSAPTSFTLTAQTSTSVSFSWTDNATNETGYEVESCNVASCSSYAPVTGSPFAAGTTSASVSGLLASTAYRFRVRAISTGSSSSYLSSADVTTAPSAPTVLTVGAITKSSIDFSWIDNASDEVIYEIQKCLGASCSGFADASNSPRPANTTTYSETGLIENTIYRFRVRAKNSNGSSAYLTSSDVTTLMAPPTSLTITSVSNTSISLSWIDNSFSETGYDVESCSGASCSVFSAVAGSPTAVNSTSITVSGLSASTIYRFRVRAAGTSPSTYITSGDTTTAPAEPTAFVNGTIAYNSVGFSWTDNASDESNYQVERCTSPCSSYSVLSASLPSNTTSYSDTSVSGNTTYRYRVRAVNTNGNSSYLTSSDITTAVAPTAAASCASPNTAVVDRGLKGIVAGTTRGLYADVKYIPSGTTTGTGAASGNTVVTYSTNAGVAYYDTGALSIKYAYWNGSTFQTEVVAGDSAANVAGIRLAYFSNSPNIGIPIIYWVSGNAGANAGQIMMAVRSTASLTTQGTWTVSVLDTTGGSTNRAVEVSVSPIDQVLVAYQATTTPVANAARALLCTSSCTNAANYLTMGASQVAAATATQIKLGAAWCNRGSGVYNPAITYGDATAARFAICRTASNNLSACQATGGWTVISALVTAGLVVTDLHLDANITSDVPKVLVKDATNVKVYKGNVGCSTTASFATTSGTILGSNVANTANSFYKFLKYPDYGTPTNERYMFMFNDSTTDVKWANSQGNDPSNTTWNQAGNAIQTVTINGAGATTGGADLNSTTGQMIVAYGTLTGNTFNITLGVVDNFLLAPNAATQVYFNLPVDSTGHIQLNSAQQSNIALSRTSTNLPGMAYVDFSAGAATTGKLKYAIRNSPTFSGSSWVVSLIPGPTTTFSPQFPSLAYDNNDKPWIGYFEANTNRYYLATNTSTDGSGTWINYQFPNAVGSHGAPSAAAPAQNSTAVAMSYVAGVASPVMIIADTGTTDQLKSAKLNTSTGVWSNNTQISALGANGIDSLSADFSTTSNVVVISFYDITTTRLRYAVSTDAGASWPAGLVNVSAVGTGVGVGSRVRLNPVNGFPSIAYYDRPNGRVFYSYCSLTPANCSATGNWSGTSVAVLNGIGIGGIAAASENLLNVGLTFSAAGDAYINYTSGQLDLGAIRMIDNVGGTMPSGLSTSVRTGSNGAFSNAAAVNGGIPFSVQSERMSTGYLGVGYLGAGNVLSYTSCGD